MNIEDTYPFGEVTIPDVDYAPEAIMYKFAHIPSGKWYAGMHGLSEYESPFDGSYWNSSTDKEFKELLSTNPKEFKYEILKYGSIHDMLSDEHSYLKEHDARKDTMSWNKTNGIPQKPKELPDLELIESLVKDAYNHKNPNRKSFRVEDIPSDMIRLQVRFETTKSQTKVREYRDRMKLQNNTNGFTLTIVVNDGKWILAGGNHSLYSAIKEGMPYIDIVFIEAELTLDELYALGGGLNRKADVERMSTEISSIARDLSTLFNDKKISDGTFQDKYSTQYMKTIGNLTGQELTRCRREAIEMIDEKASLPKGKKWRHYTKNKKNEKDAENIVNEATTRSTYATWYSGSAFSPDRVMANWCEIAKISIENGKLPKQNITVYLHWPTQKSFTEWSLTDEWEKNEKAMMRTMYGYIHLDTEIGVENFKPNIKWKKLPQYESDVTAA